MRLLSVLCALVLVVGIATTASAEVQNIKVSGDLTVHSIWRENYDLDKDATTVSVANNAQNYFMSIAELQVDADLTDNVATCVRILNQRDWDDAAIGGADGSLDVILDLAYVQLKEILYSPLTLKIGRQDLWFGEGFIVGAKNRDPDAAIACEELTAVESFDAIRATLDYDPWLIDLIYSKIEENVIQGMTPIGTNDDADLWGANVGYTFDSYNGEAEGYFFSIIDRTDRFNGGTSNEIDTVGVRGSFDPFEDLTLAGEVAYQFGDYSNAANIARDRSAMALDIHGEYRFPTARWTPKIGAEYVYLSGETDDAAADTGNWDGWHPVFTDKSFTAIRQLHNLYYTTAHQTTDANVNYEINPAMDSGVTNAHQILISGSVYPTENISLDAVFAHFWYDENPVAGSPDDEIGDEIDLTLVYDYTEDVVFSLLAAWFIPGQYFPSGQDDIATNLIASMAVSF